MYSKQQLIDQLTTEYIYSWQIINDKEEANAPIIIWLNGGPGASSLEGLFIEKVGPFFMDIESGEFKVNDHSWTQFADLLFVDNPIGVGFSYTESNYVKSEDEMAFDFVEFLIMFYQDQDINDREIWIAGESYAGKYIPFIAREIQYQNDKLRSDMVQMNLKGIIMGNGWYSPITQQTTVPIYAFNHKLIDQHTMNKLNSEQQECTLLINDHRFMQAFKECEPIETDLQKSINLFGQDISLKTDIFIKSTLMMSQYLNQTNIKSILGINTPGEWTSTDESGPVSDNLKVDVEQGILQLIDELVESGLMITMYNGMRDGTSCNYIANTNVIKRLRSKNAIKLSKEHFQDYHFNGQHEGHIKNQENFTFLLVNNSGHFVPLMQPALISDYIRQNIQNHEDMIQNQVIFNLMNLDNEMVDNISKKYQ